MRSLGYIMGHHDAVVRNVQTIIVMVSLLIASGAVAYTVARIFGGGKCKR